MLFALSCSFRFLFVFISSILLGAATCRRGQKNLCLWFEHGWSVIQDEAQLCCSLRFSFLFALPFFPSLLFLDVLSHVVVVVVEQHCLQWLRQLGCFPPRSPSWTSVFCCLGEQHVFDSWQNVLHCVLWLRQLVLLPSSLTELDDFRDGVGHPLSSLRARAMTAQPKPAASSSALAMLGNALFALWSAAVSSLVFLCPSFSLPACLPVCLSSGVAKLGEFAVFLCLALSLSVCVSSSLFRSFALCCVALSIIFAVS